MLLRTAVCCSETMERRKKALIDHNCVLNKAAYYAPLLGIKTKVGRAAGRKGNISRGQNNRIIGTEKA